MSGIQFAVAPQIPAQITGVAPIVVEKSGLAYTISLSLPGGAANVAVVQIKQYLVFLGAFDVVAATIPGDPKATLRQIWDGGGFTQQNGPLLTSIFATLSVGAPAQPAWIAACLLYSF